MELHISENIRAYRKQRNMMQEQLAGILGVSVGAVSKWERGAAVPDLGYIVQIAELFEVSVDSLLGYELNKSGLAATLEKLVQCSKQNLFEEGKTIAEKEHVLSENGDTFEMNTAVMIPMYRLLGMGEISPEEKQKISREMLKILDRFKDEKGKPANKLTDAFRAAAEYYSC